jgi:5-methylcytosine-specific restriction protein B
MSRDLSRLNDGELDKFIAYHSQPRRDPATLKDALAERESRVAPGKLNLESSRRAVITAAREGRFLSYKDVAAASGSTWSKVMYQMSGHLLKLLDYAHHHGEPLLSAIVVSQANVADGKMEDTSLNGFLKAAKSLGYDLGDDDYAFVAREQQRVFAWAREQPPE